MVWFLIGLAVGAFAMRVIDVLIVRRQLAVFDSATREIGLTIDLLTEAVKGA